MASVIERRGNHTLTLSIPSDDVSIDAYFTSTPVEVFVTRGDVIIRRVFDTAAAGEYYARGMARMLAETIEV